MNKKSYHKIHACAAVATCFFSFSSVDTLLAGSDKQEVIVEDPCHDENLGMTVFIPEGASNGSYLYEGKHVTIPAGKSVTLPSGASQVVLPRQTIAAVTHTGGAGKVVTDSYVITGPTELACMTVHDVTNQSTIVPIGERPPVPPERRPPATDGN